MQNQLDPTSSIIDCPVCKNQMAALANACPKCGAPNDWRHPDVVAFLDQIKTRGMTSRPFSYWHNKFEVWGETKSRAPWWAYVLSVLIIAGAMIWALLGGSTWWMLALSGLAGAVLALSGRKDSFKADLRTKTWVSSNEKLWRPVRDFLKV